MIPSLNLSGVLPPFISSDPTISAEMAPYKTNLTEIVSTFANTPERVVIIQGLLNYRQMLRNAGIVDGFQWLDGSYVENCEQNRGRPPRDIDVVTFAQRPQNHADDIMWGTFVINNQGNIFNRNTIKQLYKCDAFYEDLNLPSSAIVSRARFWFGLFSHQRSTFLWKGLLEIPLTADDAAATSLLNRGATNAP